MTSQGELRRAKIPLTSKDAGVCPLINMEFTQSATTIFNTFNVH